MSRPPKTIITLSFFGVIFLLSLLFLTCSPLDQQSPPLSLRKAERESALIGLWKQTSTLPKEKKLERFEQFFAPFTHTKKQDGQELIRLLLSWKGSKQKLRQFGAQTTEQFKDLHSIWLPITQLESLLKQKELKQISFGRSLHAHLRSSSHLIGAVKARISHKLDGRGVIVGIIDTGIDYRHPAFRNPDGKTRLLAIVDYSLPSRSNAKKEPPRIFLQKEIDQALSSNQLLGHKDTKGHGTHIAGIASGNSRLRSGKHSAYSGIAPRSDIIAIKGQRSGRNDFISNDIIDGIIFIHRLAKKQKKPYVINLSLGGHQGGHDGSSLLERTIDVFSGKGRKGQVVVASAGNEGRSKIHTNGWVSPDQKTQLKLILPKDIGKKKKAKSGVFIELWTLRSASLKITIISPQGTTLGSFGPSKWPKKPIENEAGSILLQKDLLGASMRLGFMLSGSHSKALQKGTWLIQLEGKSPRFDAWITESTLSGGSAYFQDATQEMLVGTPASAKGAITVGSFNSSIGWKSAQQEIVLSKLTLGALSDFSSPGPTRDGRAKPEIIAPGIFIAAAASGFVEESLNMIAGGPYQVSQGTSQSAPHVAGAIALLLQKKPTLDTEEIRSLLIRTSRTDKFTTQKVFDRKSGFGKLEITKALQELDKPSKAPVSLEHTTLGSLYRSIPADGISQTTLYIIPKSSSGQPTQKAVSLKLTTSHGSIVGTPKKSSLGIYQVQLQSSQIPTAAVVSVMLDQKKLPTTLEITFTPSTKEQGCQCNGLQMRHKENFSFGLFFILLLSYFIHMKRQAHCKKTKNLFS